SLSLASIDPAEVLARIEANPPTVHALPAPLPATDVAVEGADRGISSAADIMREEIAMIPRLLAEHLQSLAQPIAELARSLTQGGIEHLYMTGCGDSAFSGEAAAL